MPPKDTIILHIGMHKTATTSIQAGLKDFTDGTTRFARLGRSNHSVAMITAFAADAPAHPYFAKRGIGPDDVARRRARIREGLLAEVMSPERNMILSGEEMGFLSKEDLFAMRDMLGPATGRFRVIAYVREPVGFSSSAFQQVVRHRKVTALLVPKPQYKRRFSKFIAVFGRAAVEFVPFHPPGFSNGCIVTDFCGRVGIDPEPVPKVRKNESLSAEAVALLLDWNRHGRAASGTALHVRAAEHLIAVLRQHFPGRFRFHPERVRTEIDPADCEWMERVAGFSLPPPEPAAGPAIRDMDDIAAMLDKSAGDLAILAKVRGIRPLDDGPAAMMDALFAECVEWLQSPGAQRPGSTGGSWMTEYNRSLNVRPTS